MNPSEMGRKGGSVKGKTKRRGDSDYYRKLALKSAKARKLLPKYPENTKGEK